MVTSDDLKRCVVSDKGLVKLKLEGSPTILIVDDEELMREVSSIMVEENGGKVITAVDGLDAVETFAENKDQIACVFMDFSMPRMNGHEALVEIRKIDPAAKILFVSGLKMTPEVEKLHRDGKVDFLSKPFHEIELIKALKRTIEKN
ncbi:MAG: response regulator [Oligoflexia bacterium]|nr:response regulator [Oligoflexia bacterium]